MKITDIKQQVKRAGRYSIYVDGKYSFSLAESELMAQTLRIGQEFDKEQFEAVTNTAIEDKAYMRALDLLARRQRSVWEMEQYLKRKGYEHNTISKLLNKLSNGGLLDDEKFAEAWVNNRRQLKSVSVRRLKQELQQKKISAEIISKVLTADETDESEVLRDLIAKKRTQSRYHDNDKLIPYLLRQGFNYGDIKDAIGSDVGED